LRIKGARVVVSKNDDKSNYFGNFIHMKNESKYKIEIEEI